MKYNGKEHDLQSRINERRERERERERRVQMPQNIKQLKN